MKLRTKITIAFLAIILVPILMVVVSVYVLNQLQMETLRENYGITNTDSMFSSSSSLQVFTALTSTARKEFSGVIETNLDALEDSAYLDQVNQSLVKRHSFLIVRKDQAVLYTGNPTVPEEFYGRLPAYVGEKEEQQPEGFYLGGDYQFMVSRQDFQFADGSEGSLFIVTNVGGVLPEEESMIRDIIYLVILVLVLTAFLLTAWLYSTILRPLNTLKKATREIKEGNLDFVLEVQGKDEISELCQDFEDMRQRLKESSSEKMQHDSESKVLISNISHDLKTPITAIKGYVEGIMDGVASSPEKLDKYIRTIYNKANDMDRLIDELTLYSKIDTNRIPYTFSKINVEKYFSDCAEEMRLDLESKKIDLTYYNYLTEDVTIIGDTEQLKRVINNIVSNSVKYLDKKKGIIIIRVRDAGDFVQVEIEDNGRGIGAKDLPYIFDRFYRADASRNSSTGGSGIGLSIVKKVIEDHGGKIWATSKEETGTIMHFVLRKYQEVPL